MNIDRIEKKLYRHRGVKFVVWPLVTNESINSERSRQFYRFKENMVTQLLRGPILFRSSFEKYMLQKITSCRKNFIAISSFLASNSTINYWGRWSGVKFLILLFSTFNLEKDRGVIFQYYRWCDELIFNF